MSRLIVAAILFVTVISLTSVGIARTSELYVVVLGVFITYKIIVREKV